MIFEIVVTQVAFQKFENSGNRRHPKPKSLYDLSLKFKNLVSFDLAVTDPFDHSSKVKRGNVFIFASYEHAGGAYEMQLFKL